MSGHFQLHGQLAQLHNGVLQDLKGVLGDGVALSSVHPKQQPISEIWGKILGEA